MNNCRRGKCGGPPINARSETKRIYRIEISGPTKQRRALIHELRTWGDANRVQIMSRIGSDNHAPCCYGDDWNITSAQIDLIVSKYGFSLLFLADITALNSRKMLARPIKHRSL